MTRRTIFYSDFNCPFCYALNERLRALGAGDRVEWRLVEHVPSASSRHTTPEELDELSAEVGVLRRRAPDLPVNLPRFRPSTRLANWLVVRLGVAHPGAVGGLRTELYRAYWQRGEDISDAHVLRALCARLGLTWPTSPAGCAVEATLGTWQADWEGAEFGGRLPVLAPATAPPVVGFPTLGLLCSALDGKIGELVEGLATCALQPRQTILAVGEQVARQCSVAEVRMAYEVLCAESLDAADEALSPDAAIDLIVVDASRLRDASDWCSRLRRDERWRNVPVVALLSAAQRAIEPAIFDAGFTDVVFDLSNPKVCQARLAQHLRRQRNDALLRAMTRRDYLTQLDNRLAFERRLEMEWARAARDGSTLALIFADIDFFEAYNDRFGSIAGDECLHRVARVLRDCARRPADVISRYGGEEFALLLPSTPLEGASAVADRLRDAVRDLGLPAPRCGGSPVLTISAGVAAMRPALDRTSSALVQAADDALCRAKAEGRDRTAAPSSEGLVRVPAA